MFADYRSSTCPASDGAPLPVCYPGPQRRRLAAPAQWPATRPQQGTSHPAPSMPSMQSRMQHCVSCREAFLVLLMPTTTKRHGHTKSRCRPGVLRDTSLQETVLFSGLHGQSCAPDVAGAAGARARLLANLVLRRRAGLDNQQHVAAAGERPGRRAGRGGAPRALLARACMRRRCSSRVGA